MKNFYLVESIKPPWKTTKFIIEASSCKNAINEIFNSYFKKENLKILKNGYDVPCNKKDLIATSLDFETKENYII